MPKSNIDVYAACPSGSGKKYKFCCAVEDKRRSRSIGDSFIDQLVKEGVAFAQIAKGDVPEFHRVQPSGLVGRVEAVCHWRLAESCI